MLFSLSSVFILQKYVDGVQIAGYPFSRDTRLAGGRDHGMSAKFFALFYVGNMHFHGGDIHRFERVENRVAVMRIGGGIDDYPARLVKITLMDKGNYLPFTVALKELDLGGFQYQRKYREQVRHLLHNF